MPNFVKIAKVRELSPGENKVVNVNGQDIALANVGGEFFAVNNTCPHRGGSLGDGFLEGEIITCPLHGWRFNVRNGNHEFMPQVKISCYQVKVEGDDVLVSLD